MFLRFPIAAGAVFNLAINTLVATEDLAFFENQVRPLLVKHCYECHSEESDKRKGGLWLDRRSAWEQGGDGGPSIVPGAPDKSLLIHSVRYGDPDLQMPPKSKLSQEEIGILEKWVAVGAPDPRDAAMGNGVRKEPIDYVAARKEWAFRPVTKPAVPVVKDSSWATGDVDRFILASLEAEMLAPAADSTPAALIRRVHYDLAGLPPTVAEFEAFEADPSPEALAGVVDELLARPSFGEKWGRHWLDVARYADSNGGDRNYTFYQAWRYRNYVIDAFNRDKSYYDFIREQVAGDLMEADGHEARREQLIASTFLALGPKMLTERDKEKLWLDTVDEQIDTVGRAFLGLTMGCARCHDHKFDPVSQEDYYAVAGIFRSTEIVTGTRNGCVNVASWIERPLPQADGVDPELKERVDRLELAMRLTVEKSYMKKAGGKMALGNLPLAGVIYDETDAELVGEWTSSSRSPSRFGESYIHDDQKGKGERKAVFRGSVPETGLYEVRVAYSAQPNRARRVPVRVNGEAGAELVYLDQTRIPEVAGLFQPVGRFRFEKGGECAVTVETGGTEGGYVIVDAVQFIAEGDIEREKSQLTSVGGTGTDPLFRMNEGELKKELDRLIEDLKGEDLAMAPRDAKEPSDVNLRVRGEVALLGPLVPRGFPRIIGSGDAFEIPKENSGRLEFAQWLTDQENGLLDRVIVNRIWGHLFGRGIVETVDNFGRLGSGPSHPELLDYLAASFREKGGSFKSLVRELILSHTYRLSALPPPPLAEADPANRFFGRQNRRRLTAEEMRDSVLFLSGQLDRTPGTATATAIGIDLDKPLSYGEEKKRTVYLPVARNNPSTELSLFDGANPDFVSGQRIETTVPTQALYLLNSEFLQAQAMVIGRLAAGQGSLPGTEVDWVYRTLLGRRPDPVERQRALGLIADLSGGSEEPKALEEAIGHLAHLILASSEFLYLE